ncbi:MAG TPA: ATP-dependent helicase [Candidatus Rubrimentiphilum sp.]|nr:ATP-dependent helicase [Candidatus Rubrimentiphilum sp.]
MSNFITGASGTGKTTELLRRASEAAESGTVLLTAGAPASLDVLRVRCGNEGVSARSLDDLALEVLFRSAPRAERPSLIDDVQAALLFEDAAQPLLSMEWTEFLEAQVDPEVPGLRAPQRFLDAAFQLFRKFRDALVSPEQFLESALRGATSFYANPPNFAHPDLLYYTKETHQNSLNVDGAELQRQYRHEVDLAKILAKLYRSYLDHPVKQGCLTARDAVAEAVRILRESPALAGEFRALHGAAFVDDAQELTLAQLHFLQAIYGENLEAVTLAGDENSAASTFRGARPDRVFAVPGERVELAEQRRSPFAVDVACRHLLGTAGSPPLSTDPQVGLTLFRASTRKAEAQFIAEHVAGLLAGGAQPREIALLFRSVANVRAYCDALLDRNIPAQIAGDLNLFSEPEALDALAVLWLLHNPFRHEYLLRVLSGEAVAFADSTLAALCAEPADSQTLLFTEEPLPETGPHAPRWDPMRDVRLGWNVLRGDRDRDLPELARDRLMRLRELRNGWLTAMRGLSLPDLVRLVWSQGLARSGEPESARGTYQQLTLRRLYDRVESFAADHPDASLAEFLEYAEARMNSEFESCETIENGKSVNILSIDAARGREFDHIAVPNIRAGAFPRYYVPDAFLYSPSLGMIAKENVGEARAARTAKFTYYMFRSKTRERYNREERRAFVYALRRAKRSALVTAHEKATRGIAAPEFLAELQAARLPGTVDLSDKWHPSNLRRAK